MGEPDPAEIEDVKVFFKQFAGVLEKHLEGWTYLVGDRLAVADLGAASFLPTAADADLPLADCPEIRCWYENLMQILAWREPWPQVRQAA